MKLNANSLVDSVHRWAQRSSTDGGAPPESTAVLVVDDEPSILVYVERILRASGYRIATALNAGDAMALIAAGGRFDLLITDVVMPETTGAELASRLLACQPDLKVLFLTGWVDKLFDERPTLQNEEAFLEKPFTPLALRQAVSLALTGSLSSELVVPVEATPVSTE